jgi:hypothetical protein
VIYVERLADAEAGASVEPVILAEFVDLDSSSVVWRDRQGHRRAGLLSGSQPGRRGVANGVADAETPGRQRRKTHDEYRRKRRATPGPARMREAEIVE